MITKSESHVLKNKVFQSDSLIEIEVLVTPPSLQWRLGRPLRRDGRLREGGSWRNNHQATVSRRQVVWRLLPKAAAGEQPQEPVVPWVLAASLSLPPQGSPTGEQQVQPHLWQWVEAMPPLSIHLNGNHIYQKIWWFQMVPRLLAHFAGHSPPIIHLSALSCIKINQPIRMSREAAACAITKLRKLIMFKTLYHFLVLITCETKCLLQGFVTNCAAGVDVLSASIYFCTVVSREKGLLLKPDWIFGCSTLNRHQGKTWKAKSLPEADAGLFAMAVHFILVLARHQRRRC